MNPQTLRQALTFIDVILQCQSAIGDEIEREKLVYIYNECIVNRASVYTLCYVDIVGSVVSSIRLLYYVKINGKGEFFSLAYSVKVHVQFFCYFYVYVNVKFIEEIFLCCREKTCKLKNFLN